MMAFPLTDVKAGAYQAGGRLSANVGPSVSVRQASLFGVFHSSALVGLMLVVCLIQHVETASGPSVRESNLI